MKIIMNCIYQKNSGPNKDYRNASSLFVDNLCIIKHSDKDQLSHIFSALMTLSFSSVFWLSSKAHFVYCQNAFLKFIMKIGTTIHNTKVTKYL